MMWIPFLRSSPHTTAVRYLRGCGIAAAAAAAAPMFAVLCVVSCGICRPLALGNAADAVEILSAGYILNAFKQEDGSPLTSTQKGKNVNVFWETM